METVQEKTLTADELLGACFGEVGSHAYLRVVTEAQGDSWFRQLRGRGWREFGAFPVGREPDLRRQLGLANRQEVRFFPALLTRAAVGAPLLPVHVLWCTRWVGLAPGNRVIPDRVEAATQKLLGAAIAPTIVVTAGGEVAGVWRLTSSIPVETAEALLARLAAALGGDRGQARPRDATLPVPGTRVSSVFPAAEVRATRTGPPVALEALAAWLVA